MAASRRAGRVRTLLFSLAVVSVQGTQYARPPWTWNNGGALALTVGQPSSTYRKGAPPYQGFTMGSAVDPIVAQFGLGPSLRPSNMQYPVSNINSRTRTEGEKAIAKQTPSHREMHELNLLTSITNSSLSNAGKSRTPEAYNGSTSTASQRSLDALDGDATNNNIQDLVAVKVANPEVGEITDRAKEIPKVDIKSERVASATALKLSGSSFSKNEALRSGSTSSSKLIHLYVDDPNAGILSKNISTKSITKEVDESSTNAKKSSSHVVRSRNHATDHSSSDAHKYFMRRSAEAASAYYNKLGISARRDVNPLDLLQGNNFEETPYRFASGPTILTVPNGMAEEFTEILTRLRQISQEFVDIYKLIVSAYAPNLKTTLEIPSLEQEISAREDSDYSTITGPVSEIRYAVAKGKGLIQLYKQNLKELHLVARVAVSLKDDSSEELDDALRVVPSDHIILDELNFRMLSDLDHEAVSHTDGDDHKETGNINVSSSAFTGNTENENDDKEKNSQDTTDFSARIDGGSDPDKQKEVTSFDTEDFEGRVLQRTNASRLTVDTVKDRLHKPAENEDQSLGSTSNSNEPETTNPKADDQVVGSRSNDEGSNTGRVLDGQKEDLGTKDLQQISNSKSTTSKNDNRLNIPDIDSVTSVVHEHRFKTNLSQVAYLGFRETDVAGSYSGESERNVGISAVSNRLAEGSSEESINDSTLLSSSDQAKNARQHTDLNASALGRKSLKEHTDRNKETNRPHQLPIQERKSGSQDHPIKNSNPIDHNRHRDQGTITAKLGHRENTARTTLQNEGSMRVSSHGFPGGSSITERINVGNTDSRAPFPRVKGLPMFPDRKFSAPAANRPHPSFAESYPNWMVRGRRSVGQETPRSPADPYADEVLITLTDETYNYGSSPKLVEKIEMLSTNNDDSQRDSTENENSNSMQPRLLDESVVESSRKIDTIYTKLLDNIMASTALASDIQDSFERLAKIFTRQTRLQGSNFLDNTRIDNTSYLEKKARASVKHVLSKYSTELSDILKSIVAEDTGTVVSRALSIYYLKQHRLLNNLLLESIIHVVKRLNEPMTRREPFEVSQMSPVPSVGNQSPYHGLLSASPKMKEFPLQLPSDPVELSNRQREDLMDVSSRYDLQGISMVKDGAGKLSSEVEVKYHSFDKEDALNGQSDHSLPIIPEYRSLDGQNEAEYTGYGFTTPLEPVDYDDSIDLNEKLIPQPANQADILPVITLGNGIFGSQIDPEVVDNDSTIPSETADYVDFIDSIGNIISQPETQMNILRQITPEYGHFGNQTDPEDSDNSATPPTDTVASMDNMNLIEIVHSQIISQPQNQLLNLPFNNTQHLVPSDSPIKVESQQTTQTHNQETFLAYNSPYYLEPSYSSSQHAIIPYSQQPFSTYHTQYYQSTIQPQMQEQLLTSNYYRPQYLASNNFPGRKPLQQATQPHSQQTFSTYNIQNYQMPIQPQMEQQFLNYYRPHYLASHNFPGIETPQQATQPHGLQPFSTYSTPKYQAFNQPQIQQGYLNYDRPKHLASQKFPGTYTPQQTPQPYEQQPFSGYNTPKHQTPNQPLIQQGLANYDSPHYLTSQNFPKIGNPQQATQPYGQQSFSAYNTKKHQAPNQPQIQPEYLNYDSAQHIAAQKFPGIETLQQATQLHGQQSFSAYNTPRPQIPNKPQIQQGFLNYNRPQHSTSWYLTGQGTPQQDSQPQIQQPLPDYNIPQHQTSSYFSQLKIQQPQHQIPAYYPQPEFPQPLPAYNPPQHQTPLYYPQQHLQQPLSAYSTPEQQTRQHSILPISRQG